MYSFEEIRKFEKRLRAFIGVESALSYLNNELLKISSNVEVKGQSTNAFSSGAMDSNSREKSIIWFVNKKDNIVKAIKKKETEYIILKLAFNSLNDEEQRIVEKFYFQNKSITSISMDLHYSDITIKRKKKKAVKKLMDFINEKE